MIQAPTHAQSSSLRSVVIPSQVGSFINRSGVVKQESINSYQSCKLCEQCQSRMTSRVDFSLFCEAGRVLNISSEAVFLSPRPGESCASL